jgi:hypothetical protein
VGILKRNRRLRQLARRCATLDMHSGELPIASTTWDHEHRQTLHRGLAHFWRHFGLPACQARIGRGLDTDPYRGPYL